MSRNVVLGGITLALSLVYFWLASSVRVSQLADAVGPQGLPKAYSVALAALSIVLIAGSLRGVRDPKPAGAGGRSTIPRVAGTLLIGIIYILLLPWVGYFLSIASLILVTSYYQGGSLTRTSVLVAIAGGAFFWVLFVGLMGIAMPAGIFPPEF